MKILHRWHRRGRFRLHVGNGPYGWNLRFGKQDVEVLAGRVYLLISKKVNHD